jgi:microcompartment protein CcmK/EutM
MKRGVLVGEIWASRKVAGLHGKSLKLVIETPSIEPDAALFAPLTVAIDTLDGRAGQPVLVAYGSGARNVLSPGPDNRSVLADAAVAVLLDSVDSTSHKG